MKETKQPQSEYELKLKARITSDLLIRILSEIGTAGASINFMEAYPVLPAPVLAANPEERLVPLEEPWQPPVVDHEEIKRLAKKLAAKHKQDIEVSQ